MAAPKINTPHSYPRHQSPGPLMAPATAQVLDILVAITTLTCLVYCYQILATGQLGEIGTEKLWSLGGNGRFLTVHGEWWRLVSSMFLHLDSVHLVSNMFAFWMIAKFVTQEMNRFELVATYLISGVGAGLASLVFQKPWIVSVGASGAIFGLYGAVAGCVLFEHAKMSLLKNKLLLASILVFAWQNIGWGEAGIDVYGHLGGFVSGFALAGLFSWSKRNGGGDWFPITAAAVVFALVAWRIPKKPTAFQGQAYVAMQKLQAHSKAYLELAQRQPSNASRLQSLASEEATQLSGLIHGLQPLTADDQAVHQHLKAAVDLKLMSYAMAEDYMRRGRKGVLQKFKESSLRGEQELLIADKTLQELMR